MMHSLFSRRWIGAFLVLFGAASIVPVHAQVPAAPRLAPTAAPVESGYLGLIGDDRITGGRGVQILSVRGRGAAEAAGLRTGDIITAINRQPVNTVVQMAQQLAGVPAGKQIEIEYDRGGQRFAVPVTLGPRPAVDGAAPPPAEVPLTPPPAVSDKPTLGIRVISPLEGARRGYVVYVRQGALIEHIQPNSPADRYGLSLGSVIVAIDGKRIDDAVDLAQAVAAVQPGDVTEVTYYRGQQLFRKKMRLTSGVVEAPLGATGEIVPKVTEFPPTAEGPMARPRVPPPPPRPANPLPMDPAAPVAPPKQPLDPLLPPPPPVDPGPGPAVPAEPVVPPVPVDPSLPPPPVKAPIAPPVAEPVAPPAPVPANPMIVAKPPLAPNPLPPSVLELDRKLTEPPKPVDPPVAKPTELGRLKAELAETVSRITSLQKEQQQLLQTLEKLQRAIDELEKNGER